MKQSQTAFARATKLEGKPLARFGRDVVDAAIRGSFDICTDSMARIRYHRDYPPEPAAVQILEREEFDCAIEDDEETEMVTGTISGKEPGPGMSQEIKGLDDDFSPIERLHASVFAHDAAVTDKRVPPDVDHHPHGNKSTKQRRWSEIY
jgi:hypothetical protein